VDKRVHLGEGEQIENYLDKLVVCVTLLSLYLTVGQTTVLQQLHLAHVEARLG
jgi:hypothetical protein